MQGTKRDYSGRPKVKPDSLTLEEQVLFTTIPCWKVPYEDQISEKVATARQYVKKLSDLILTRNPNLASWMCRQQSVFDGLMCRMEPIIRAASPCGYKSKCDFRCGINEETGERVVGFKGNKGGVLSVRPGDKMIHLPHQMKLIVKMMEDYVRQSPLPPYVPETRSGFWHHVSVRVSMAGEAMLLVSINANMLTPQQLQFVKTDLTNFFFNGDGHVANIHSLYLHPHEENQPDALPENLELLGGVPRLVEPIMGINFHIGPFTHFMSTTCAAQSFYGAICSLVQPGPQVTLVDICCGIGAIGLTLAKKCKEVYAIDMQEQHISDGVITAQMNNITNFSFLHGRVEEQLGDLLHSLEGRSSEIVCVLDPPRLGTNKRAVITDLAFKVVDRVRQIPSVSRFIYVCNNQKGPVRLFLDFCASPLERGTYQFTGLPFVPTRIIPLDMAPHTPHSILLVLLERCSYPGRKPKAKKQQSDADPLGSATYFKNQGYC